jgi:predicted membrane protein
VVDNDPLVFGWGLVLNDCCEPHLLLAWSLLFSVYAQMKCILIFACIDLCLFWTSAFLCVYIMGVLA